MQDLKIVEFLQIAYVSQGIRTTHDPEFASKYLTNQVIDHACQNRGARAACGLSCRDYTLITNLMH